MGTTMAKCGDCERGDHVLHYAPEPDDLEAEVTVLGGPNAYVWIGDSAGKLAGFVTGKTKMRKLAMALLKAVGDA